MAFDKRSGDLLHQMPMAQNATGSPMTYKANGRQFIVFPVTCNTENAALGIPKRKDRLVAVALPN